MAAVDHREREAKWFVRVHRFQRRDRHANQAHAVAKQTDKKTDQSNNANERAYDRRERLPPYLPPAQRWQSPTRLARRLLLSAFEASPSLFRSFGHSGS